MAFGITSLNPRTPPKPLTCLARLAPFTGRIWHRFTAWCDAQLPRRCHWCEGPAEATDLCQHCIAALPWNTNACGACGMSVDGELIAGECGTCQSTSLPYARTIAPLRYDTIAISWVARLKSQTGVIEARLLSHVMADAISNGYTTSEIPDLIVPVPLATGRLMRRGYNQALLLARPLSKALDIPLAVSAIRRVRGTPHQRGLSRSARMTNLRGAFVVQERRRESLRESLQGRRVAIVDDVMTTGETVAAVARTLRRAGASSVHVWVAARA